MAGFHFQGTSALALDAKGRFSVPARHREMLAIVPEDRPTLTLTRHPDGCLMVFPRAVWEDFRVRIASLPLSASGWKRLLLGSAMEVELDSASRVLVSPELRAAAALDRQVLLIGMGNHLELWDVQRHSAAEAALLQQPMPAQLQDFSF
ncbi:division/cell wall cluster transcriptional repressor MraZ [Sphaerotilus sp.]|uniref:division/cell wall cluster transcriptional repressor MraZ n=1 Tax=Sphaerotilus sp. TaxID=2093942 RepID=UPI002ACE3F25|nr:division/cell wall cluster transcriptional repressor MraZ [Sphaerotilus sp.]MDZ7855134.1 division/cell wall cluster transcriptional repressor MraZ [Sphaerotilus sp.]